MVTELKNILEITRSANIGTEAVLTPLGAEIGSEHGKYVPIVVTVTVLAIVIVTGVIVYSE